jgi:uncharacterized protein (TIGR04255 family)
MGRKYKEPPIVEAVCEFRFQPEHPWDITIPGLVFEKIQKDFPNRETRKEFAIGISPTAEGVQQQVITADRIRFLSQDGKEMVQVGPDLLAVNRLRPYISWEAFKPVIEKGFKAYTDSAKPKGIQRIGLRYINRIEIPGERIRLEDYFEFYPYIGDKLPQEVGPFITGIQIGYEQLRDMLKVLLVSVITSDPQKIGVSLDLDYFLIKPCAVSLTEVFNWMEVAHNNLESVFEACIKEKLRQMLQEVS